MRTSSSIMKCFELRGIDRFNDSVRHPNIKFKIFHIYILKCFRIVVLKRSAIHVCSKYCGVIIMAIDSYYSAEVSMIKLICENSIDLRMEKYCRGI